MLHLRTLGAFSLDRADGSQIVVQRRPFALLAFVAAAGARGISREKALGVLWPDNDEERARHALAQTLYALRRSCGADVIDGATVLRLDPSIISADVSDLECALADREYERAATLYAGSFLDGFHLPNAADFEQWLERERSRLQGSVARAIESCATSATGGGKPREAAEWWRRLAGLDPLDSRIALALAESLESAGDVAAAIKQVQLHQTLRRSQLDLPPDPALERFARRLRATTYEQPEPPVRRSADAVTRRALSVAESTPGRDTTVDADPELDTPGGLVVPATVRDSARSRVITFGAVACAVVVLIVAGIWYVARPGARSLDQRRVVVTVFENRTSDTTLAPVGDMAADWTATELARTGLVDVVDSRAVIGTGDELRPNATTREVVSHMRALARSVGAGIVVWGNYYRRGDSLEFHAQVTDVRDGALLREVPPVVASVSNPVAGVQRLGERIMGALATVENPGLSEWAAHGGTPPSYGAYREFMDGLEAQVRMDQATALVHYSRARALDSTFLEPLLFGADAAYNLRRATQAEAALDTVANHRDELIPADRDLLDYQLAVFHGDPEHGYEVARDMARLSPTSGSFVIAGQASLYVGRPREALQWFERVDPNKGWVRGWAEYWIQAVTAAHMANDDEEGLRLARLGRRAFPDQVLGYVCMAIPLVGLGQDLAVEAEMDSAASAPGQDWRRYDEGLNIIATELFAHGKPAAARQMWQRASDWYAQRPSDATWPSSMRDLQARVLVNLGEAGKAGSIARSLLAASPDNPEYLATAAIASANSGDTGSARAVAIRLARAAAPLSRNDAIKGGAIALARAQVAAATGDSAATVSFLQEAIRDEYTWIYFMHRYPIFRAYAAYRPLEELAKVRG